MIEESPAKVVAGVAAVDDEAADVAGVVGMGRPQLAVRPLAPATVEAMRAVANPRDAALMSVLAYSGLRPQEALALRWGDIRERTILVERAVSRGEENDTKTSAHRTVRLLAPLREDLLAWRMREGRPGDGATVFPGPEGRWSETTYDNWRRSNFDRALGGRRRPHDTVCAAPHLRVVAALRGSLGDLRGAPARARRAADAQHLRARDRRAGRRAADASPSEPKRGAGGS